MIKENNNEEKLCQIMIQLLETQTKPKNKKSNSKTFQLRLKSKKQRMKILSDKWKKTLLKSKRN